MSNIPNINTDVSDGYASLIGHNWDTVQEAFKVRIPAALAERLEKGKQAALDRHEGQGAGFQFAGQQFQIWSGGSQGNKWVIENDDIQIHFRTEKETCKWPVSVRYRAAGLWEYGFQALKDQAVWLLEQECVPLCDDGETLEDWCHISTAHYAFDFYSPKFSDEMWLKSIRNNVCLTSGVKMGIVGTSQTDETITIGMNRAGVQVQVYDKGKEITEISGKTWMFKVWEREGYFPPAEKKAKDVWRVEIRFGKEFLRDRNIIAFKNLQEKIKPLLAEALMRRRIVQPPEKWNKHKERWGFHPLWAAVYHESGGAGEYVPIGRQITLRRAEMAELLEKQMAGIIRSKSVLTTGHFNENVAAHDALRSVTRAKEDEDHDNKTLKCVERYRFIDEAK